MPSSRTENGARKGCAVNRRRWSDWLPFRKNKTPTLVSHYKERLISDRLQIKDETVKLLDENMG